MKKTFKKIDRGTLLKGSGAAALLTMLATATADAKIGCCEPGDDGFGFSAGRKKAHNPSKDVTAIKKVLIMKGTGTGAPTPPSGYTQGFVIPYAIGFGHVLHQGKPLLNEVTNKDIYVFIYG